MEKKCSTCGINKEASCFKERELKCDDCKKAYQVEYRKRNKEKAKEYIRLYYSNNKEKLSENNKRYYNNNKEKWETYNSKEGRLEKRRYRIKTRMLNDPEFRIVKNLRNRLWLSLRNNGTNKNNKTMTYVGCTKEELKLHLEQQFTEGMSWENYGQWHIDHKIPFKYYQDNGKLDEEALYKVMHYTNLQPLWEEENCSKGGKYLF